MQVTLLVQKMRAFCRRHGQACTILILLCARRKQPGIAIGRLCDGKCVTCYSDVRPCTLVRVCDECNYGSFQGRCVICSVEEWGFLTPTIAKSAHSRRKTGMVVQKLSIWGALRQICFTNVKNMVSRKDDRIVLFSSWVVSIRDCELYI